MSKFDAEYNEAKNLVVEKIQQWVNEQKALKAAGTKISKSGVKQAERAKRSVISSTDETFGFLVEESLSKDLSGEAIKNKIRGLIERQFPKNLRLVSSDRIHHKNALELVELVSQQSPDVVLQFLQRSEKEGYFYGDSLENTRGASFTEASHTAAFPQDNASGINYPKEYGAPGEKLVSGHPAGTNDPRFKFQNKTYGSGDELFDAIKPALAFSADALDRALFADRPREEMLETLARNQGLLEPGENVRDLNPGPRLQAIQKFAEEPDNKILIEGSRNAPASYGDFLQSPRPNLTKFREQFPEDPLSKLPMGSPELETALGLDFSKGSALTKGFLKRGLGRLVLPSAGSALSLALGAGDVQAREERVKQDPSLINKLQAGLAKTERAADVAGLVPGPQSIVAEPAGFVSGLANVGIDAARDPIGTLQAVGGSYKWLVGGGAAKQQRQILNPLSTRL